MEQCELKPELTREHVGHDDSRTQDDSAREALRGILERGSYDHIKDRKRVDLLAMVCLQRII
jgi:hypothetical protein